MSPQRGITILFCVVIALSSVGFIVSIQTHSYYAAKVFFGVEVVLIGVLAAIHHRFVTWVLKEVAQAVIEWKRRREEDRARLETERLERQRRIEADARNQEILDLYKHAAPHLMLGLDPVEFERYVLRYFRVLGYDAQETKVSGDGGIDGKLRRNGGLYLVQCKRYTENSVGEPPVRDLLGAMTKAKAAGGFFVTTSSFTPTAVRFATGTSIELIDGKNLAARIKSIQITDPIDRVTWAMREDGAENGF